MMFESESGVAQFLEVIRFGRVSRRVVQLNDGVRLFLAVFGMIGAFALGIEW